MKQLSEIILGHLLNNRGLIDKHGITIDFFKDRHQRLIFKELNNGDSDIALIAQKINIPNIGSYLSSLLDDLPKTDEKNMPKYIAEVKKDRLRNEVLRLIENGAKTGNFDHDKIQGFYQEIRSLEMVGEDSLFIDLDKKAKTLYSLAGRGLLPDGAVLRLGRAIRLDVKKVEEEGIKNEQRKT